ncbi:MAG: hypothetical protein LBL13_01580 [Bacteroidales bacterium]|nr:hypothetical protein [Bacteroidales bacterium]
MLNFRTFAFFFLIAFSYMAYTQELKKDSVYFSHGLEVFNRVKEVCDIDNGKLLGFYYYCPLMLVDRESRVVLSNTSLAFSDNAPLKGIYYGTLPEKYLIANTAISIDSTLYSCVSIADTIRLDDRMIEVCLHEMCHYWVNKNNIHLSYNNEHIDNVLARTYFILEMRALQNALLSTGKEEEQEQAILDALTFRKQRNLLFPKQIEDENKFEFDEGFPDFVAYTLFYSNKDSLKKKLFDVIEEQIDKKSFYRTFGYVTGAVYAHFIRDFESYRTTVFQNLNIVSTMMQSRNIKTIPDTVSIRCKDIYNFEQVKHYQDSLEQHHLYVLDSIKYRLKHGAKIMIKSEQYTNIGIGLDGMFAIDTLGTYFSLLQVIGDFGWLKTEHGAMHNDDGILIFIDNSISKRKKTIEKAFDISFNKG